ncbi:MAG: iron-siderophore ABC transporter substrate-binding protein [Cyanobacteria bacterium J06635_13]
MISKIRNKTILIFLATLITLVALACDTNTSDTSLDGACRIMSHAKGETCIPIGPQRLVTISEFTLYHALFLGVVPIGNAFDNWRDTIPTYMLDQKNTIERIEKVGQQSQPNLEKILRLKPDLIVSWGDTQTAYPLLSQIAPTVIDSIDSSGNNGWREHFNFVAEALGKESATQQAWSNYYRRVEDLKSALGKQYENETISVLTVAHDFENHATTRNSFAGSILDDIGLRLAKAQNVDGSYGWVDFSTEEFTDFFDGDILFVTVTGETDRKKFEELKSNPLWEKLKAVQKDNVYLVDSLTWQGGNLFAAYAVIDDLFRYLVNTP